MTHDCVTTELRVQGGSKSPISALISILKCRILREIAVITK